MESSAAAPAQGYRTRSLGLLYPSALIAAPWISDHIVAIWSWEAKVFIPNWVDWTVCRWNNISKRNGIKGLHTNWHMPGNICFRMPTHSLFPFKRSEQILGSTSHRRWPQQSCLVIHPRMTIMSSYYFAVHITHFTDFLMSELLIPCSSPLMLSKRNVAIEWFSKPLSQLGENFSLSRCNPVVSMCYKACSVLMQREYSPQLHSFGSWAQGAAAPVPECP